MDQTIFTLHTTGSDTYRVLVNGNVNPHLVGFYEPWQAQKRLNERHPGATMVYALHQCAEFETAHVAWFLASRRDLAEFLADEQLQALAFYVLRRRAETMHHVNLVCDHLHASLERAEEIGRFWDGYVNRNREEDDETRLQISDDWHNLRDELGDTILVRPIHEAVLAKMREKQEL